MKIVPTIVVADLLGESCAQKLMRNTTQHFAPDSNNVEVVATVNDKLVFRLSYNSQGLDSKEYIEERSQQSPPTTFCLRTPPSLIPQSAH